MPLPVRPRRRRRFRKLLEAGYFTGCRFHRVVPGFIIQWGIPADPKQYAQWGDNKIKDDPVKTSNTAGTMSFATSGPDCRGSQVFINYEDSCSQLDDQGFAPFGKLTPGGLEVAKKFCEMPRGPDQAKAKQQGNAYFTTAYPQLSYIKSAKRV